MFKSHTLLTSLMLIMLMCGLSACGSDDTTPTYLISTNAGVNGTVSPTSLTVEEGDSASFIITADTGYELATVDGCNGTLSGNTYSIRNVSAACSVSASFVALSYLISTNSGANGSISPSSLSLGYGATGSFTITPDNGYTIDSVSGCGGSLSGNTYSVAAASAACTVSASFSSTNINVSGLVLDPSGRSVSGVEAFNENGVLAVSDSSGALRFDLPMEESLSVRLRKPDYTNQTVILDVFESKASFISTLGIRNLAVSVSAEASIDISGQYGASVFVSTGSLVDDQGNIVTGMVDLNITPIDVSDNTQLQVFPGAYAGVDQDGVDIPGIMPYGTVEYYFSQNGQELNLAPGATAAIEIPIFVTKHPDGSPIQEGEIGGLVWYLNEVTGIWVKEGTGTVVASENSPTNLAMRMIVEHFSFWNYDYSLSGGNGRGESNEPDADTYSCRIPLITNNAPISEEPPVARFTSTDTDRPRFAGAIYLSEGAALRIPKSLSIEMTAEVTSSQGGFYTGSTTFSCDDEIAVIDFAGPLAPIVISYKESIQPIFELNSNNIHEISGNTITFSWDVRGHDSLNLLEATLPVNIPLLVAKGSVDVVVDKPTDAGIYEFALSVANEQSQFSVLKTINFVLQSSPVVKRFNYFLLVGPSVQILWQAEGADEINIGYVTNGDIPENYMPIAGQTNIQGDVSTLPFNLVPNLGLGYQIVIEFRNQYGSTYKTFSRGDCPLNSDAC